MRKSAFRLSSRIGRALDQVDRQPHALLAQIPRFREVWQRLQIVGIDQEKRPGPGQTLVHADVDAAPALAVARGLGPALGPAADDMAHGVAVSADAVKHVRRGIDRRFDWKALGYRRQLARRHEGADEFRLRIAVERAVGLNLVTVDQNRLALRVEDRRIGRGGRRHDLRGQRRGRHSEQERGGRGALRFLIRVLPGIIFAAG